MSAEAPGTDCVQTEVHLLVALTFLLVSCSSPPMMNSSRIRYTCSGHTRLFSALAAPEVIFSERRGCRTITRPGVHSCPVPTL